ncbi:MFS transporter [Peribacillus acanthi]|uniref:MFS transporter n=1 Tax=Peribacillus acanthi TaxID=2171554 RepID=UPI000D3E6B66|nr:MFS transporter [Peribacillus acanthi]
MKLLLKNKSFSYFLLGEAAALFGSTVLQIAISLYLLEITQSAGKFASALMIGILPTLLFGLIVGVIVDLLNRKKILLWLDAIRGLLLLALGIWSFLNPLTEWVIYALLLFLGVCQVFFLPAFVTVLPSILNKEDLVEGNSIKNTVLEGAKIAAPLLGAFLYTTFGIPIVFILSALFFVLSYIFISFLHIQVTPKKVTQFAILTEIKEGVLVLRDVRLSSLILNGMLTHIFLTAIFQLGFPFMIKEIFHGPNLYIGIVESCAVFGIITSVFIVSAFKSKLSLSQGILYGIIGMIITVIPLFLLGWKPFSSILVHQSGVLLFFFSIVTVAMFWVRGFYGAFFVAFYQQAVAPEKLGRFFSIMSIFFSIGQIIGFKLYGYLLDHQPIMMSILVLGLGMIAKAIVHIPFMKKEKQLAVQKGASLDT